MSSLSEQQDMSALGEPIAVIGMSCRFSGEASSIEGFWEMLRHGRTGHGPVPSSRYQASAWHHPSHERKGAINHDSGFFIEEDPSYFDAPFFSITAKEAAGMDPVQRLLLEVAYEAFENGGVPMEDLAGSRTAVFSGCMTNDYELLSTSDMHDMPHNSATGNGRTMLANRLSWFFDLRGPSVMLDTACSSSLTAAHIACQAIRAGECNMALVTGASLILHPNFTQRLSYMHMLSADGISHSFDAKANGYGRGEGLGAVLLKPLSAAVANGDVIRSVIRATGINQDGRTPGITMPSRTSQADLIQAVYGSGQSSMRDTAYFEAHGTGTEVGDPTELAAIGDTLGAARADGDEPIYVGSVKSNIGHTEGAAGVASLIKTVLCLEKGMLVPNAGFTKLNPRIKLNEWGLRLSDACIEWPRHLSRRVSINSFGFGGSNTHLILESASMHLPPSSVALKRKDTHTPQVVVFSAQDMPGLERLAAKWTDFLQRRFSSGQDISLRNISHSMSSRRSKLPFRSFAVAESLEQLCDVLQQGLPQFPRASRTARVNLAFIFTGQGAQWAQMGIQLLDIPVFRNSITRSQQILSDLSCPWDLLEEMRADSVSSNMSLPDRSQSICCALQIALVDLLASWGVHPKATVGHSSGEIGAAYAARFITHETALRIAYFRGYYSLRMSQGERRGAMMAVGISSADVRKYLETLAGEDVVVACVNSPNSVTLSGDEDEIDKLEEQLKADGCFARKLQVKTAYHSPHMRDLAEEYESALKDICPISDGNSTVTMLSSVTKEQVQASDMKADYWVRNMVSPVEFSAAVSKLTEMKEVGKTRRRAMAVKWNAFLEIGPHEALKGPFHQTLQPIDATLTALPYQALVRRNTDALQATLGVTGMLWSIGASINIDAVNSSLNPAKPQLVESLPSYAWNHSNSFWHEPLASSRLRQRKHPRHDLLGVPFDYQNDMEPRWRNFLRVSEIPWLSDHVVAGSIVFPAAGMVSMVAEAARQLSDPKKSLEGIEFNDLSFMQGMVIPDDGDSGLETVLHVAPHRGGAGWYDFGIFSLPKGATWIRHATGSFIMHYDGTGVPFDEKEWDNFTKRVHDTQAAATSTDIDAVYNWLSETGGVTLGPKFRSIADASFCKDDRRLWMKGVVQDTQTGMPYEKESSCFLHPTALDALFQAAVLSCSDALTNQQANIPIGVDRLYLSTDWNLAKADEFAVHTETYWLDGGSRSDSIASDCSWSQPRALLKGIQLGRVPMRKKRDDQDNMGSNMNRFSSLVWKEHLESSVGQAPAAQIHYDGLEDWIERFRYTHGDARALVVIDSSSESQILSSIRSYAPDMRHRPRLQQLTVVCVSAEENAAANSEDITKQLAKFQAAHISSVTELDQAVVGEDLFDLVLVDRLSFKGGVDTGTLLESLASITEPDCWLAIHAHADEPDPLDFIGRSPEWNAAGLILRGDYALAHRKVEPAWTDSIVFLLTANRSLVMTSFQATLEKKLTMMGLKTCSVSLRDTSTLAGKTVISLVEFDSPWVSEWTSTEMSQFQELLRAKYVLWASPSPMEVTDASSAAGFGATTGLLRTLRNEHPTIKLVQGILHVLQLTVTPLIRRNPDLEYRLEKKRVLVPRVLATESVDEGMHILNHGPRPALSLLSDDSRSLQFYVDPEDAQLSHWMECSNFQVGLPDNQVEVQLQLQTISASGSAATYAPEASISVVEAVGIVRKLGRAVDTHLAVGDAVLVLAPGAGTILGMTTRVRIQSDAIARLPSHLSLSRAVATPLAYTLAYASLFNAARLESGSSVLLIGAFGHTLRALLNSAQDIPGVRVCVAAVDQAAADEITAQFPGVASGVFTVHGGLDANVSHFTGGKGVTAVISCLGGSTARVAARCLSAGGVYVDLSANIALSSLSSTFSSRGCTFVSLNLNAMLESGAEKVYMFFRRGMNLLQEHHNVHSGRIFSAANWADAEEHARLTGTRSLVHLTESPNVLIVPPVSEPVSLSKDQTFVLAGGLGTLGLALARTLADIGAHHVVILSRSAVARGAHKEVIDRIVDKGCLVDIVRCDISQEEDVTNFISHAETNGWDIKGLIQCATNLKDAMFDKMSFEYWRDSTYPKIRGTLNLHRAFADKNLDFFLTLSSVASLIGNIGQANYSAGNSFMDDLMAWRQANGLPGHSINIGLVPDGGSLGEGVESIEERTRRYSHLDGTEIHIPEIQSLVQLIIQSQGSIPAQIVAGLNDNLSPEGAAWRHDRKFEHRIRLTQSEANVASNQTSARLKNATSSEDAVQVVNETMQEYLAAAMATTADTIDLELPLSALGVVDSLKVTELQNWVLREMGAELSSFEFLGSQPLKSLSERIAVQSTFVAVC
ncbi:Acyl transferase/acyl hydrolase/lysophospholipase [Penicillium angulare]|uniref:Acyl transferase/acyl hydrolase/lysophospholipase n=1 Tax=Penicillium angulare TaxID=116970 RepID=A0A9W9KS17_9EURO|nr:Acyl transferase/acyl hydrolase/lysophospholipase [Penicillium angulare]